MSAGVNGTNKFLQLDQVNMAAALKWLNDMSGIGNKNAALIVKLLNASCLENSRYRDVLINRLAPAMKMTIGQEVHKGVILEALSPIRDLLGAPTTKPKGDPE